MKEIPLTQGYVAIVDDENYEELSRWNWCAFVDDEEVYAVRTVHIPNEKRKSGYASTTIRMHRQILRIPIGSKSLGDHINRDTLDNRRKNLRRATNTQNCWNSTPHKNAASKYKGVWPSARKTRWIAKIVVNGEPHFLGSYVKEADAALAFDEAARKFHGEFAYLNFPDINDYSELPRWRPSSGYFGVSFRAATKSWTSRIKVNGKDLHIGYFDTERDAALAHDWAARKHFGENAKLNFPDEPPRLPPKRTKTGPGKQRTVGAY